MKIKPVAVLLMAITTTTVGTDAFAAEPGNIIVSQNCGNVHAGSYPGRLTSNVVNGAYEFYVTITDFSTVLAPTYNNSTYSSYYSVQSPIYFAVLDLKPTKSYNFNIMNTTSTNGAVQSGGWSGSVVGDPSGGNAVNVTLSGGGCTTNIAGYFFNAYY